MEVFKPFRATVHRQQKYYSEKRINDRAGFIFNLPKQVIEHPSTIIMNSHIISADKEKVRSFSHEHNKKILNEYQNNLKKTVKKNPINSLSKKALEKAALSLIVTEKDKKSPEKIPRNKSVDSVSNKNMSFETLNILYRTIIETKAKKKSKPKFEVNAKKLPILEKLSTQIENNEDVKRHVEVLVRNTPFGKERDEKYVNDNINDRENLCSKKECKRNRTKNLSNFTLSHENENIHILSHRRRFERRPSSSLGMNEIIPWNQISEREEDNPYYLEEFAG